MAQQIVNNNDSGLDTRDKINENFTELYGALNLPIRMTGISGNAQVDIPANSVLLGIVVRPKSGSPVLSLGTIANGGDLLGSQAIAVITPVFAFLPFIAGGTIYATLSGGSVDISIITVSNVF